MPEVHWYQRTLDYLDLIAYPLRPSVCRGAKYRELRSEIETYFRNHRIKTAAFELIETHPGALIIRAHGKNPESDVSVMQEMINRTLALNPNYQGLSEPEPERRGGNVTCQIALKPFNDDQIRTKFVEIMSSELEKSSPGQFSVLKGGATTIDIQLMGVNKQKAIRYLINERGIDPQNMIYFGNEFNTYGNDRPVAQLDDIERPAFIVDVGGSADDAVARKISVIDDKGPTGTLNYLKLIYHQSNPHVEP